MSKTDEEHENVTEAMLELWYSKLSDEEKDKPRFFIPGEFTSSYSATEVMVQIRRKTRMGKFFLRLLARESYDKGIFAIAGTGT